MVPSFSQKFLSFYYQGDPHFAEGKMQRWMKENDKGWDQVPESILDPYNRHDIIQLRNLFLMVWDVVIRTEYWEPYMTSLMVGEPLAEMETEGGLYIDHEGCRQRLHSLQKIVQTETRKALEMTDGVVLNANSSQQLGRYFSEYDKLELELTDSGEFRVDKSVLVSLRDENPLADCAYRIREANGEIKYFENYLNALEVKHPKRKDWIPVQYSQDAARTRRFTSQSLFKLNFQNPSEAADEVSLVPPGYLGWWIDATQIENVVHIYETEDWARRKAYEEDANWNEYVWLCNMMYGETKTKDEWDNKEENPHPIIGHWSKYKGAKTAKLAANFGMGIKKYAKMNGVSYDIAEELMHELHAVCPAIRGLQNKVAFKLKQDGYVTDSFDYRYTGPIEKAYKVVAYLIQGCGTGSLPKSQIRSNWETIRKFDRYMSHQYKAGVMCTTTHDENGGRISLALGTRRILQLLQKLDYNMTEKFSPKFDNIPLRAKLYLSKTNAANSIECDIKNLDKIATIIEGKPCPACGASGKLNHKTCNHCKGTGYV